MLAVRIRCLRRCSGMSQAQLAQKLHISTSAAGMYEQGRRMPDLQTLVAMAQLFHVSLDYLITGSEFQPCDSPTGNAIMLSFSCPYCPNLHKQH